MLEMLFETATEVFFCFKLLLENFKRVLILLNRIIRLWERGRAKGLQPGATLPVNSELIIDDVYILSIRVDIGHRGGTFSMFALPAGSSVRHLHTLFCLRTLFIRMRSSDFGKIRIKKI